MPVKGLEPQRPFPKKFYPRFTRGPVHLPELQQKESKIGNPLGNHVQDPVKGEVDFSPEMGKCFSVFGDKTENNSSNRIWRFQT